MEKYIYNEQNGLWYELQGDYYIPCLVLDEEENQPIGMWGRKHLRYIKEHRRALYTTLLISGKLNSHLVEIDNRATEMFDQLLKQLAEKEGITEEQRDKIVVGIKEDSEWLVRMVENLLSITRIDSSTVKIQKTPTALEELIDSVALKFKKRYPAQKVEIETPSEMIMIPMDAILIEQVIVNILENAV